MVSGTGAVIITDAEILPGNVLVDILGKYSLKAEQTSVITNSCSILYGKLPLSASSVDFLVSLAGNPGRHGARYLEELGRIIRPGGSIFLQEPIARRDITPQELKNLGAGHAAKVQTADALLRNLLLAGFSTVTTAVLADSSLLAPTWAGITSAAVGMEHGGYLQPIGFTATRPQWELGSSFSLRKGGAKSAGSGLVKLQVNDLVEPAVQSQPATAMPSLLQEEIIDGESLLTEEDMAAPLPVIDSSSGCDPGMVGRKACKNCTCGRAELEAEGAAVKLSVDQSSVPSQPTSACGSCGLGDAFRCAGCPYRGLPAFKMGEKVSLSASLLSADVA